MYEVRVKRSCVCVCLVAWCMSHNVSYTYIHTYIHTYMCAKHKETDTTQRLSGSPWHCSCHAHQWQADYNYFTWIRSCGTTGLWQQVLPYLRGIHDPTLPRGTHGNCPTRVSAIGRICESHVWSKWDSECSHPPTGSTVLSHPQSTPPFFRMRNDAGCLRVLQTSTQTTTSWPW